MAKIIYNNETYQILPVYENEHIIQKIRRNKTFYEVDLLNSIKLFNLEGTYIDVGANMGNHSIFFLNICKCDKLICFEPFPLIYQTLIHNIRSNNKKEIHYEIYNSALSNNKCLVEMKINESNSGDCEITSEDGGTIKCDTLDNLIHDDNVKVIKIDSQGYELKILQGGIELISKQKPLLACEASTNKEFVEIDNFLKQFGYNTPDRSYCSTPTYIWNAN